ncbi:hypothetical protein FRC00_008257, partial [Tulasnella sp. 408]
MDGISAQEARAQRFGTRNSLQDRYDELSRRRREEIKRMQAASAEDSQRTLDTAVALVGTCQEYCPEFEKVERQLRNEVKRPEMRIDDETEPDYTRMVKAFARPNDINSTKLPSDIRPPPVLQAPFYLKPHPGLAFKNSYSTELAQFVKTSQFREAVVELLQWNVMSESHVSIFCRFTNQGLGPNRIVIGKLALTTLMQYYDDFRAEGVIFPNEAEFRAYRLLLQMRDGDVGRRTQRIPSEVFASPWIQSAITLRSLLQHPSSIKSGRALSIPYAFTRLLKELKKPSTSLLMACLVDTHLMTLRKETLRAMAGSYLNISISVPTFQTLLGFNTPVEAEAFATEAGLKILTEKSPREIAINKSVAHNITPSQPTQSRTQSAWLVEKRGEVAWADIIDGKGPPPGIVASIAPVPVPAPASRGHDISFGTTRHPAPTNPHSTAIFGGTSAFAQKPQAPPTLGGTSAFGPAPSFPVSGTAGSTVGAKPPTSIFGPSIFGQRPSAGPSFGAGTSAFKPPSSSLPTA